MKPEGYSSVEAMLSLLMLLSVLLSVGNVQQPAMGNLYILQKEHDLLKLWAKEGIPTAKEMVADFEFAFPGKGGEISTDGTVTRIGTAEKEAVSAEMTFFDSEINRTVVVLRVFK